LTKAVRLKPKKRKSGEIEMGGQDSFLDLVSNVVGILIILVMIAGIRAQSSSANVPNAPEPSVDSQTHADLQTKYEVLQDKAANTAQIRQEAEELRARSELVANQIHRQSLEHAALFDVMTSVRAAIETAAEEQSSTVKEKIEYQRQLLETNAKLEQINNTKASLQQTRPRATVLENIPTPFSKMVEEKEIHLRLLGGKIVYVPFMELLELLRRHVSEEQNRYIKQRSGNGKVGPIDNFELEFLLAVFDVQMRDRVGMRMELQYAEVVPKFEPMGEPLRTALASPDSSFRRKLALYRKDIYTVTVWVYPDSFEEYQELKKFLYEQGYSVAARPISMGHPISGSPHGTKSSAQ
jgi:hypothetical protein